MSIRKQLLLSVVVGVTLCVSCQFVDHLLNHDHKENCPLPNDDQCVNVEE